MWKYSTIFVNSISFVISIIIFFTINIFSEGMDKKITSTLNVGFKVNNSKITKEDYKCNTEKERIDISNNKNINNGEKEQISDKKEDIEEKNIWILEIPKINLKQEIKEGTSFELMNEAIGHFEETEKEKGNIGLAAHNRGCKKNFFKDLKKLEKGDLIIYTHRKFKKKYKVLEQKIIKDTDWSSLEQNNKNEITLITCVENEPEYRRCVKAIESEETK